MLMVCSDTHKPSISAETVQEIHQIVVQAQPIIVLENDNTFTYLCWEQIASVSSLCLVFRRMNIEYVMTSIGWK